MNTSWTTTTHTHTKQRQSGKQSKHRNCVLKRYLLHPLCIRVDIILLLSSSTIYTLTEQQQRKQYQIQMFFFCVSLQNKCTFFLYTHSTNEEARPRTMMMIQIMGHDQYIYKHFFCFSVFLYNSFLLFFKNTINFYIPTFLISKEGKEKNIIVHKMRRNWQKFFFFLGKHYMLHIDDDAHSKETFFLYVSLSPSSSNILEC